LEQKKGDLELIRDKNMKILDNFIWHGRACKISRPTQSQKHWHGRATLPDSLLLLFASCTSYLFSLFLTYSPWFLLEHSIDVFLWA